MENNEGPHHFATHFVASMLAADNDQLISRERRSE